MSAADPTERAGAVPALDSIEVRDLRPEEIPEAVGVLARGMRDNPLHVAAYGSDPARRLRSHGRLMTGLFRVFGAQQPIVAVAGGVLVGVAGMTPPGRCQPTFVQRLRLLPDLAGLGLRVFLRVSSWLDSWSKHDPKEPHVHLGPVSVDAHLQGHGIGTLLMEEHCRRLDAHGHVGYLETDKPENVSFYERAGYVVIEEAKVIGVPNWFMRRPAREGKGGRAPESG
jgi:GNAT superfamily N-acetyltransferase